MAQSGRNVGQLKTTLDSITKEREGVFAIVFKDLKTQEHLYINERIQFHAASTMKTPVMIEAFKQAAEGKINLDDSVVVKNSFRSIIDGSEYSLSLRDDSEDGLYSRIGQKEAIRSLIFKMITVSSNLATNILIGIMGPENIMTTVRSLGAMDMMVLRGVEDQKAFDAKKNNTTTALDLAILFEQIARKTAVSEEASNAMIQVLLSQKFNDMIPAHLPSSVRVAHKTGSISNVQHDSGIIYLPDGREYILILLSKNLKSNKEGIEVLGLLSKAVYEFVAH